MSDWNKPAEKSLYAKKDEIMYTRMTDKERWIYKAGKYDGSRNNPISMLIICFIIMACCYWLFFKGVV